MRILTRWEPARGLTTLQDQINRLFSDSLDRTGEQGSLSAWAPAVDIYETEHELASIVEDKRKKTTEGRAHPTEYNESGSGVPGSDVQSDPESRPTTLSYSLLELVSQTDLCLARRVAGAIRRLDQERRRGGLIA